MRKNLVIGILKETKAWERRTPLVPSDVNWLIKRGISVEVEYSPQRIFTAQEYKKNGAQVLNKFHKAALLLGVKGPAVDDLYEDKIYMVFSHSSKGQAKNVPLLKACLKKKITLIDYEKIVDWRGKRLVYFGRFAGICGIVDSLHCLGKKLKWKGIKNPLSTLQPAYKYRSLKEVKLAMAKVNQRIQRQGFEKRLSPFVIGITGHGNVSRGVQEILKLLNPVEIHPRNMLQFLRHQRGVHRKLYKIVFLREEKFRSKDGKTFYFEDYLKTPKRFESNLDLYLPHLNMLIHAGYWDARYPRLVTKEMVHKLARRKPFRLNFIGDISCDVNGAIELTYKATSPDNSTFTYDPKKKKFLNGYKSGGITISAVDNLPAELPKDASTEFSRLIRDYVYQVASYGTKNITRAVGLPREIRQAVITQNSRLTKNFNYLKIYAPDE
ncbi:MAG: hypothetical protein ISS44_02400 [Candidatus Omnitrophica bacterium]|nr:hypothetical protein [Candidatus Omnitrophota bacterium]